MSDRTALVIISLAAALLTSAPALAQITAGAPSIQLAANLAGPNRILPDGTNLGPSTRPVNLTPLGVSYADCIQDQTLQFPLIVTNFAGQNLQVWATEAGDCTQDVNRGVGGVATCWLVSTGKTGLVAGASAVPETITVRVQDVVAYQGTSPPPTTYQAASATACATAQPSFTAVPLVIYFIAVVGDQFVSGSVPYQYNLNTDLVGPPAPLGSSPTGGPTIKDGDTLFIVNWTPNIDSDTIGYDLFIDPPPGGQVVDAASTPVLVCDEIDAATTSTTPSLGSDAGDEASADAASDAPQDATVADASGADATVDASGAQASVDASCHFAYVGGSIGSPEAGACNDPNLAVGRTQEAGVALAETEDATALDDGAATDAAVTTSAAGGISGINSMYMVPAGAGGLDVPSESTGEYTITGLKNGTTYTVVVSAVDAFGNVGSPSGEVCDYPAPVNDFFTLYRAAGGQAGGSFCALEAVGAPTGATLTSVGFGAAAFALVRRRRRKRG